jgi:hypothetical protein
MVTEGSTGGCDMPRASTVTSIWVLGIGQSLQFQPDST